MLLTLGLGLRGRGRLRAFSMAGEDLRPAAPVTAPRRVTKVPDPGRFRHFEQTAAPQVTARVEGEGPLAPPDVSLVSTGLAWRWRS